MDIIPPLRVPDDIRRVSGRPGHLLTTKARARLNAGDVVSARKDEGPFVRREFSISGSWQATQI